MGSSLRLHFPLAHDHAPEAAEEAASLPGGGVSEDRYLKIRLLGGCSIAGPVNRTSELPPARGGR
jgi:hypothetical protein